VIQHLNKNALSHFNYLLKIVKNLSNKVIFFENKNNYFLIKKKGVGGGEKKVSIQ